MTSYFAIIVNDKIEDVRTSKSMQYVAATVCPRPTTKGWTIVSCHTGKNLAYGQLAKRYNGGGTAVMDLVEITPERFREWKKSRVTVQKAKFEGKTYTTQLPIGCAPRRFLVLNWWRLESSATSHFRNDIPDHTFRDACETQPGFVGPRQYWNPTPRCVVIDLQA